MILADSGGIKSGEIPKNVRWLKELAKEDYHEKSAFGYSLGMGALPLPGSGGMRNNVLVRYAELPSTVKEHTILTGTMTVTNCASEREVVRINLTVKNDTTGFTILTVDAGTIDLPPGQSKSLSITLNTATATPGSYHATATATVDGLQVGSATVTFTVTP